MNGWENFLLAEVGASAALTGLIFIGVSINLKKILSVPRLPNRALEALLILLTVLIVSSLLLVPAQSLNLIGNELLFVGLGAWIITIFLDLSIWRNTEARNRLGYRRQFTLLVILNQLTILPYIIAGVMVLLDSSNGFYWLVPAVLFSFIKALLDSWVLLVEINR